MDSVDIKKSILFMTYILEDRLVKDMEFLDTAKNKAYKSELTNLHRHAEVIRTLAAGLSDDGGQ